MIEGGLAEKTQALFFLEGRKNDLNTFIKQKAGETE